VRQDLQSANTVENARRHADASAVADDVSECAETSQNEFRIVMLLPIFLSDNAPASAPDSSMQRDDDGRFRYKDGRYWINPRSLNALEFYEGALLAVDSLKKHGLNAKIHVFDTMRDTAKMTLLLKSPVMKEADLIIGPFYTELVNQVAAFARTNKISYVSPIAAGTASLKNNPYLIQVNCGEINTVAPITDFISRQQNIHVTLIGNAAETDQTLFNAYLNRLKTLFADSSLTVCRMSIDSLQQPGRYLKKKRMNAVILPAADEAFVNVVIGQLNASVHNYRINLYGQAGLTKFVNLDLEYLHTLEFRYASAFYIDYDKPEIQRFLQQFRKAYGTEPTMLTGYGGISSHAYQFAFLGFDVAYYFISLMMKYGKDFGRCILDFRLPMLQSGFRFGKIDPESGYINTHLDIYRYGKDYTIVREIPE
jgi:ABC-type branched-subunit amino acid transport system substrate-binding protein